MSGTVKARTDRCCNPFKDSGVDGHKGKDLRCLSKTMKKKFPLLPSKAKICWECRHRSEETFNSLNSQSSQNLLDDVDQGDVDMDNDDSSVSNATFPSSSVVVMHRSEREIELEEMLQGLKDKFSSLSINDSEKLRILTIAPHSWSANKIAKEFGCSWELARKSKELRASEGILGNTTLKSGRKLSEDTAKKINDFYVNDANSRVMPGIKDVISVKSDEGRCLMQKRLLLMDLRGLYIAYNENHAESPVSFSKFAELRPKQCVLAGSSGTHSVCVCTIHQNCKLLLDAINVTQLTENTQKSINDYKDCLKEITCNNPEEKCYLGECNKCPDVADLSEFLQHLLEKKNINQVQFSAWTGTDKSTLLTQILPTIDFVSELGEKLLSLKPHSYISKQQSQFFEDKKKTLDEGEVLVVLDFSENYKFSVQDASQAFHFNNTQSTVFPVVYYYKENGSIKHKSLVFLSDSTRHDTAAVYTVQKVLIPHIKKNVCVKKLIYFSDGAKQHFKNRFQMINLVYHEADFGVPAEWHCHATAHGKGASDGVGAVFKREAARSSLLCKPADAIISPDKLFRWGQNHFQTICTMFYSRAEHEKVTRFLRKRFDEAIPVPEILKSHSFIVHRNRELFIKRYSRAENGIKLTYNTK